MAVLVIAAALSFSATASTQAGSQAGVEHLRLRSGDRRHAGREPDPARLQPRPEAEQDGYMVRMRPNLRYALPNGKCCGPVPLSTVIHLHHGVWLSNGAAGLGEGNGYIDGFYPFMAAGEEKTIYTVPAGIRLSDRRERSVGPELHDPQPDRQAGEGLHHLRHRLHSRELAGRRLDHARASDLDGRRGPPHLSGVQRPAHSGVDGKFTFPDMAKNPYAPEPALNVFTVDHPGTLISTAGHLHPGGLYDELDLIRSGASASGGAIPGPVPNSVRLFRSNAHYFDKRGPISWDMSMTATATDWRPRSTRAISSGSARPTTPGGRPGTR